MAQLTSEGALYELVLRGNKDKYFISDTLTAQSPFRNNYKKIPAYIHERRQIPPINNTDFNKIIEFDFDVAGDIYTHPTLLIDLPTWYPNQTYNNKNIDYSKSIVTDLSGVTYGYTKGIGYFLFENIQIYQDQILLQEFSGDALYATRASRGSINSGFLENALLGFHNGSIISISRNGKPNTLRLELPMIGCQNIDDGGFPSFGVRSQNFKLKCKLRALEDLVEASDRRVKPIPWGRNDMQVQINSTTYVPITTLDRYKIGQPTIYLETRHIYVDPDTQKDLVDSSIEYLFSRLYENIFYFNEMDYAPLAKGATASVTRRIDAVHPASRIVFFLRQKSDVLANRLWKIFSDTTDQEYYNNISLFIASRDREILFPPLVWNVITQHTKEDRYGGSGLGVMNWDLGEQKGRSVPYARQPEGSVNFSTADRPTLYLELEQIAGSSKNTEMRLIVDTWASYTTENRRGALKYAN
jgi:hypothetical protein